MGRKRSRRLKWPPDLKGPFPMRQLQDRVDEIDAWSPDPEWILADFVKEETRRRVALLVKFFNKQWPQNETKWLELIYEICTACEAPGFKVQTRPPGASKEWDYVKNAELFADVMSVVKKQKKSQNAAVKHIADNPGKFLNRYAKYTGKAITLHRQFVRAKKLFKQSAHPDNYNPIGWGRFRAHEIRTRDEMIEHEIDKYSAEAYLKRKQRTS